MCFDVYLVGNSKRNPLKKLYPRMFVDFNLRDFRISIFVCYSIKMTPEDIIGEHMADLVDTISVKNSTLWYKLVTIKLFTIGDMQQIKVSSYVT